MRIMDRFLTTIALALVPAGLMAGGLAMVAQSASSATAASGRSAETRCELRVVEQGAMTTLEGLVFAAGPVSGTYRMTVVSSGRGGGSDIAQSGSFTASSRQPERLGLVSLGGSDGAYTAKLAVSWAGGGASCTKTIGGRV
jgi:hypothetical protein